jgi:regulator of sirC expression with transglutaminase-like and TPR domain
MDDDFDPLSYIENLADILDDDIDLAMASLALSSLDHEGVSLGRYVHHLQHLSKDVEAAYQKAMQDGAQDSAHLRLKVLTDVLADEYGYCGDVSYYDDLQNASLVRVIDRAKGLPITLSILYIHAARAQGWNIAGLNLPGHFVCRLEVEGERLIFDPFHGGEVLDAPDLRGLVKKVLGPEAELSSAYYEDSSNREILIRLQNNIKNRKIDAEDYAGALVNVQRMLMIDPDEYRLYLDAGVLYAKVEQARAAIDSLMAYIERAPHDGDRREAELLLQELAQSLN